MMYRTILADPPWLERGAGKCKRGADRHYTLMSLTEIKEWFTRNVIGKLGENCHLYLWTTNNHLEEGLELITFLGFRYITNLVWIKDKMGLGQYFRGQHELCLFAVRGEFTSGSRTQTTLIKAKRENHSKKPYELYTKIESVSPPPYLEVFARYKRDGWDCMGDELPGDTQKLLHIPHITERLDV